MVVDKMNKIDQNVTVDTVKRLNELYTEWKTTKQIQYDSNGFRIKED
jgi:hypothetical protein